MSDCPTISLVQHIIEHNLLAVSRHAGVETELHERLMAQYRPSRVRAMFASRACRKAIMVGTALTGQQMRRLVAQLGHLQQPWVSRSP